MRHRRSLAPAPGERCNANSYPPRTGKTVSNAGGPSARTGESQTPGRTVSTTSAKESPQRRKPWCWRSGTRAGGMTASPEGTAKESGANVRQKAGLNPREPRPPAGRRSARCSTTGPRRSSRSIPSAPRKPAARAAPSTLTRAAGKRASCAWHATTHRTQA